MAMDKELCFLRRKVNRLEDMIFNMSDKIGSILDEFLSHRATELAEARKRLREEEDVCLSLAARLRLCVTGAGTRSELTITTASNRHDKEPPRRPGGRGHITASALAQVQDQSETNSNSHEDEGQHDSDDEVYNIDIMGQDQDQDPLRVTEFKPTEFEFENEAEDEEDVFILQSESVGEFTPGLPPATRTEPARADFNVQPRVSARNLMRNRRVRRPMNTTGTDKRPASASRPRPSEPVPCPYCSAGFHVSKWGVRDCRFRYNNPERLVCDICGHRSSTLGNLAKHKKRVCTLRRADHCEAAGINIEPPERGRVITGDLVT